MFLSLHESFCSTQEWGFCLDLSTSWRSCPCSSHSLSLFTAKLRQPHWLHIHEPCMGTMPQASNPWLTPWLWKRWCRTGLKFLLPLFTVSWPPTLSPKAHLFPYQLQSRGRNSGLWQTTEVIDHLLLVTYFSLETKLIRSVVGEVNLLNSWVKFANLESDMLRFITFPPRKRQNPQRVWSLVLHIRPTWDFETLFQAVKTYCYCGLKVNFMVNILKLIWIWI